MVKINLDWKKILSDSEYNILRKEGTERAFTNKLNDEKREGNYYCVGCNARLFSSKMKFDSGTGWPSFFEAYPNASPVLYSANPNQSLITGFIVIWIVNSLPTTIKLASILRGYYPG